MTLKRLFHQSGIERCFRHARLSNEKQKKHGNVGKKGDGNFAEHGEGQGMMLHCLAVMGESHWEPCAVRLVWEKTPMDIQECQVNDVCWKKC